MALIFFFGTLPYVGWMAITDHALAATGCAVACVFYATPPWLNRRGHFLAARCVPLIVAPGLIVILATMVGTEANPQLAFFILACWPFQLFDVDKELWPLLCLVALALCGYTVVESSGWFPGTVALTGDALAVLNLAFAVSLSGVFGLTLWYFYRGNQRNENALAHSFDELESARALAQSTSEAKSEFLALMSHELRTPLNGVIGAIESLRLSTLTSAQQEMLDVLSTSGDQLTRQLGRVWQLVKVDTASSSPMFQEVRARFSAANLCQQVVSQFLPAAEEKGVQLTLVLDPKCGALVAMGGTVALRQAITEVVHNAVRFSDEGQIELQASFEDLDLEESTLRVRVSDCGRGIPKELQRQVFEPFSCAGPIRNHGQEGLGLGLALARRLLQSLRGNIRLDSSTENGTIVEIQCPVQIVAAPPMQLQSAPQRSAKPDRVVGKRALVVDDNKINRMVLSKMLKSLGYEVTTANDGQLAVEAETAQAFDVILMDVQMPRMDGLEAIAEIRQREKSSEAVGGESPVHPAIIVVTANASDEQRAQAEELGVEGYLIKPCKRPQMAEALLAANLRASQAPAPAKSD